jgi:eukaryotic-like serine/threonine-protein kinase
MADVDPRIGTTLKDKWRIDAALGAGGMATVYAATHRNGKRVAIKLLHPELGRQAGVRERFVREGYLANKVGHGAVTVDDDDVTEDGAAFLVMELLEGETLEGRRERSPDGRLPVAEVASAMGQVLATLAVAHAQGIVHRDLKPENLFVTGEGRMRILDFGIARLLEGGASKSATANGTAMGTPAFLPPEQALGAWNEVDGRTDLWAVGATRFTLLSGRCVHEAENVNLLMLAAMTKAAPPLRSIARDVPSAVAAVVDRALQVSRDARWPDASAMRDALARACPGVPDRLPPMACLGAAPVAPGRTPESTTAHPTARSATPVPPGVASSSSRARIGVALAGVVVLASAAWAITGGLSSRRAVAVAAPQAPSPAVPPLTAAATLPAPPPASPEPSARPVAIDDVPAPKPSAAASATARPRVRPPGPSEAAPRPAPDPFSIRK